MGQLNQRGGVCIPGAMATHEELTYDGESRADIPALVKQFRSGSLDVAQNAGATLTLIVMKSEEYMEAVAAQGDNITRTISGHLASGVEDLQHNAALLLGQLCRAGPSFRQAFAEDPVGVEALVYLVEQDRTGEAAGLMANVTWALRHFVMDERCNFSSEHRMRVLICLPSLLAATDNRVQTNANSLSWLLNQRSDVSFRRERSLAAIDALASLKTPTDVRTHKLQPASRRPAHSTSMLGAWKRKPAHSTTKLKDRKGKLAVQQLKYTTNEDRVAPSILTLATVAAVAQAAEG